jgi:tetratricopeptide (TPR) repeat protein
VVHLIFLAVLRSTLFLFGVFCLFCLTVLIMNKLYQPSKLLAILLIGLCGAMQAYAQDDAGDISKLLRVGQADAAASRVESALASHPKDPQLRFLRGVIQIEQKKNNEAITTFQRMTEEFPDLPEPYNNLAVLYAAQGQHDKARAALELAIRTHPSYATAHENLGDVYTKMASESYNKALQLDTSNSTAQIKLNTISSLGKATRPGAVEVAQQPATAVVANVPVRATSATPVMVAKPTTVQQAIAVQQPVIAKTKIAKTKDDTDAVYDVVVAWAKAWGRKDMDAYLSAYSKTFRPASGESHQAWAAERRDRIEGKRRIAVSLESPTVDVKGDVAIVKFRQVYEADGLSVKSRKVLKLSKAEGSWKIIEEASGK